MTCKPAIWIGTSWKMHKTLAEAQAFAAVLRADTTPPDSHIQRFVMPPFTVLREVAALLAGTGVRVGAQTMHWADDGAWTGEISAAMLADCGADMVELGHSERRIWFGETDETVGLKVAAALRHGLTPLICIGETAEEKAAGLQDKVLARQVRAALAGASGDTVIFAYEPVWAIGTGGVPATPEYADARQAGIKDVATEVLGQAPACLYGGSVTLQTCAELIQSPHIDGLFIGRAAWDAADYLQFLRRCAQVV